ncbi:Hypothetical protein R9X50_00175200 [Acrodontium crateriforme]|uniref:Uncharacterized protein n=1 Tax=Acrodontium crateriforme TaxID=150365 RepID=A0AAQ3R836_9PEZI|nr:Hypothetical protein R9X50_00175200 [Acrodontium crateriforme]
MDRMTMLPWFCAVRNDGVHLDHIEAATLEQIATANRELMPAPKSPSSKPNIYGTMTAPFAASFRIDSLSHLANAVLGFESYRSPRVQEEIEVLLSPGCMKYITTTRCRIATAVRCAMHELLSYEMETFGDQSYFYREGLKDCSSAGSTPSAYELPVDGWLQREEEADEYEKEGDHSEEEMPMANSTACKA